MGRWVTLDDDQHVYISDGGKVLATRGKISSAGRGKERGKALAARSKAAIDKAVAGKKKPSVKPAGPGQAREMARSQFKVAEKIRTGKMAGAALKARYAREDALKAKLNAPKPAATPVRPKISEPPRTEPDAKGNFHVPEKQLGKAVYTGTSKEGMATFSWDKPSTSRAIEHAKAAGPSLRDQADKARAAKGTTEERVTKARQRAQALSRAGTAKAQTAKDKGATYERLRPRLEKLQKKALMLTPRWARTHVDWKGKN